MALNDHTDLRKPFSIHNLEAFDFGFVLFVYFRGSNKRNHENTLTIIEIRE